MRELLAGIFQVSAGERLLPAAQVALLVCGPGCRIRPWRAFQNGKPRRRFVPLKDKTVGYSKFLLGWSRRPVLGQFAEHWLL